MNKPTEFSVRDVELGDRTQWESLFLAYGCTTKRHLPL